MGISAGDHIHDIQPRPISLSTTFARDVYFIEILQVYLLIERAYIIHADNYQLLKCLKHVQFITLIVF